MAETAPHLLIIDARFWEDIADELVAGAVEALEASGATCDRVSVPGVLEIPAALAMALDAVEDGNVDYDGYIVIGCVMRGDTYHFDIVANESNRVIMELVVAESLALGNAILTVDTLDQAWARANRSEKNSGAAAANAALTMIRVRAALGA
jgi:6,7-dimethyl-8-ribityllumazine synthase